MLEDKPGIRLPKDINSRWNKVILKHLNVPVTIHIAIYLNQMTSSSKSDTPPEHDTNTVFRPDHLHALGEETLMFLAPYNYPSITFEQRDPKFIREYDTSPVLLDSPSLHHVCPSHPSIPDLGGGQRLSFSDAPSEPGSMESENNVLYIKNMYM